MRLFILAVAAVALAVPLSYGQVTTAPALQGQTGQPRPGGPARDQPVPKPGTGRIRGRVVSAEGTPLRRVMIRVFSAELRDSRVTSTDAQGRYELKELPAGRLNLSAMKAGYVTLQYGQRRPFEQGKPIELGEAQTLERADFTLPRGSVIAGRVVDEFGEPVADAMVMPLRYGFASGRRRLMPSGSPKQTNDLGQFRLYGLPPGDYYVSAVMRGGMMMMGGDSDSTSGYAPTYYPGTPNVHEAQKVTVAVGQEQASIDFALIATRTARLSGTATDSSGRPLAGGFVMLAQSFNAAGGGMMMFGGNTSRVRPDGTFTISDVPPGEYVLHARAGQLGDAEESEVASMPVVVTGEDLSGLVLVASRGGRITGHVVFEGSAPPAAPGELRIMPLPLDPDGRMFSGPGGGKVRDDWSFDVKGLAGPVLLRAIGDPKWTLKAVLNGGTDIVDSPLDLKPGEEISGVQIILTTATTEVTGAVTDARGTPLKDYTAIAFADDPDKWGAQTRYLRTGRPDQDGLFKIKGLPPATYLLVAVATVEQGEWSDPEALRRWRSSAVRVTLREGAVQSVSLKLAP